MGYGKFKELQQPAIIDSLGQKGRSRVLILFFYNKLFTIFMLYNYILHEYLEQYFIKIWAAEIIIFLFYG